MATYYIDPEGGNNANAGTSFATRKQSMVGISYSPNDNVRIIASPAPASLGVASWTDDSYTVYLGTAKTLTIDNCETAWTAGANVTATASATSANRKQGSFCANFSFGSFTGGLVAYRTVALDLSAYSCISLWMAPAQALTSGVKLALCSDSAGQVPIVTLPMPAWLLGLSPPSRPFSVLYENGGAALPSGINSIAFYCDAKPVTSSINVDNIIATKAWGATDHLSHGVLIGKNNTAEPEWYPIQSIDGTTIVLGNLYDTGASPTRAYRGATEAVTTYALYPLRTRATDYLRNAGGINSTAPLTITGGWNRTDMSTQTGVSWLTGEGMQQYGLYNGPANFDAIYLPDYTIGFASYAAYGLYDNSANNMIRRILGIVNCGAPVFRSGGWMLNDYDLGNIVYNAAGLAFSSTQMGVFKLRVRRITGTSSVTYAPGFIPSDTYDDSNADTVIDQIDNCESAVNVQVSGAKVRLRGLVAKNNKTATVKFTNGGGGALVELDRPTLGDSTVYNTTVASSVVRVTAANGVRWDNRVYTQAHTQTVTSSVAHGTAPYSVMLTAVNYQYSHDLPRQVRLARVACLSGKTVTFITWVLRSSPNITAGLRTWRGCVAGVGDITVTGVATSGTWEQLALTFTPTEDGVVDVFGWLQAANVVGANNASAYFSDMAVSST
jgi:hypothetical protein